jgi:hypothetical protein
MTVVPPSAREDDPQPEDGWTCTTCWTKNASPATTCVRCGWIVPASGFVEAREPVWPFPTPAPWDELPSDRQRDRERLWPPSSETKREFRALSGFLGSVFVWRVFPRVIFPALIAAICLALLATGVRLPDWVGVVLVVLFLVVSATLVFRWMRRWYRMTRPNRW